MTYIKTYFDVIVQLYNLNLFVLMVCMYRFITAFTFLETIVGPISVCPSHQTPKVKKSQFYSSSLYSSSSISIPLTLELLTGM